MFQALSSLRSAASGRKTYIIAGMSVLIGIVEGPLGIDLPGVDIGADWMQYVINGTMGATLRSGVAKAIG